VHAPRGLRRVTATVDGRRIRLRRRAIRVRPPAVVRFRGINRRGHRVTVTRRYRVCR
jgi:hypothetical protein